MQRLRDDFAALVGGGDQPDLGRAALAIARIGYPELDPEPSLRELDALAAAFRPRLTRGASGPQIARDLAAYLFGECGFQGNQEDYYDPRNSFLNDVLERRRGIPISLSVVMMETGARLGLPIEGVGFPGHFLVRVAGGSPPLLLDPFFGGREVGEDELLERYRSFLGTRSDRPEMVPAEAIEATSTRGILIRMLRNLLRVYLDRKDEARALQAVDLLLVLLPDSADDLRVRGLLYERLECYGAALDDLRRYLALASDAPDAGRIQERVTRLVRQAATLH